MERINFTSDHSLSRIVCGMWPLGDVDAPPKKTVQAKIEACLEQGITTMDQASIYGGDMAEETMGAGREHILKSADHSLRLMGANSINHIKGLYDALNVDMGRETWLKPSETALGHEVAEHDPL